MPEKNPTTKISLSDEDIQELRDLVASFAPVLCAVCGVQIGGVKMASGPEYCEPCLTRLQAESRGNVNCPVYDIDEILASTDFLGAIHSALPDALDGIDDQCYEAELVVRGIAEFEGEIGNGISAFVFNRDFDILERSLWSLKRLGHCHALAAMEELDHLLRNHGFPDSSQSRANYYDK